ncbi:rhodanese-related sulfurtransferase [Prochlorococcus marinus]|uniref:oxygen-dependent tRNA uridine(34) hydroxylase TrhO n=1 Tax=Prochlorococcus marinus TaxID=1219 RepID=UPI0022B548DC|nr:rhodanese-related sulfurtransferase [Prochlorococcus marinus]
MIHNIKEEEIDNKYKVAAFYSFSPINEELIPSLLSQIRSLAQEHDLRGTIIIALEGINGTICGSNNGITAMHKQLNSLMLAPPLDIKFSFTSKQAFRRFKARRKNEIVTMGMDGINPNKFSGKYVEPKDWNAFIDDPQTLVIDTRNEYEVGIGSFQGAINPHTQSFSEFPRWVEKKLRPLLNQKHPQKIAMFCTGGIRCEKATSLLIKEGFEEIYHLHGGILNYLAEVPIDKSRWHGECFVFDHRVALDHSLSPGVHRLCFACGMPLSPEDIQKTNYLPGIQCHYCKELFSDDDRDRFRERQKYITEIKNRQPSNNNWPSA